MKNQNEINYICARWRDCENDPPPLNWVGLCQKPNGYFHCGSGANFYSGDQWLDVTDAPAVPRAAVQRAVDEMAVRYWDGTGCILHESGERDHCDGCALDDYPLPLCKSLGCIEHHTGVTPTEKE